MHILFVEPAFPSNQCQFVRALSEIGARVTGIGERPVEALDDSLRHWLSGYEQIGSVTDGEALLHAVRNVQARGWVDRLEATVEAHILTTARVREACTIPGTSVHTAFLCRDKPAMKEALRKAGVPCARSTGASSASEARDFADSVGFPLILKPRDSAGAAGTYRVDDEQELESAIEASGLGSGVPTAVEEFIEGHEGFLDTLTVDGKVIHEFATHYYPNVLEAMRNRWISPQMVHTNRIDAPGYSVNRRMERRVIKGLGIETSATHMEWFFGPKGLKFSEIGCRPPGVCFWDIYNAANEMDMYREWALAVTSAPSDQKPSRRYSAGLVAFRPERDGVISGYSGIRQAEDTFGDFVIDSCFPEPGTPTQPVEAGYMANAWVRVRHPDYDELRRIMTRFGETLRVHS